jgi:hypothetical protein
LFFLFIHINHVGDGNFQSIKVHDSDDSTQLAKDFVTKYGLGEETVTVLSKYILKNWEDTLQKEKEQKEAREAKEAALREFKDLRDSDFNIPEGRNLIQSSSRTFDSNFSEKSLDLTSIESFRRSMFTSNEKYQGN